MNSSPASMFDYLLITILAAIFGGSFMLTKIAVVEIPAASLVAFRLLIAFIIFFGSMIYVRQNMPGPGKIWIYIFGSALFGNALPFFLISWGQEKVDAGLAAILMAMMPLMTIVIAHFTTSDEKLTPYKIIGFCFGLVGVAVMIGLDKLGSLGEEIIRQYAIIGGALCYAISAIITKSLVHVPRMAMMAGLMLVSTLLILPFSIWGDQILYLIASSPPSPKAIVSTVLLGILPTALGTMMVFWIVARQGASFLSQINFMVPVFGVLWGIIILSETLPGNAFLALALILGGVAIARLPNNINSKTRRENIS